MRGCDILDELEFVLRKIIEIDNKAIDLQNRTEQTLNEKEALLNEEIKNVDERLNSNSNAKLEKEVHKKIEDARNTAKAINMESEQQKKKIQSKYASIKDELKKQLFNEMIEIN